MKQFTKLALTAASAVAIASSAHAVTHEDLIVGFTGAGSTSGQDFIYDLGNPNTVLTPNMTWTVGTGLGSSFGVIGYNSVGSQIYSSDAAGVGTTIGASYSSISGTVGTISPAASGNGTYIGTSRSTTTSDTTGWTYGTAQPIGSPNANTFESTSGENPNVASGSQAYLFDETSSGDTELSYFTYNSTSGILTYEPTAVPEPSLYGVIAGLGVLALAVRRQVVKA